MLVEMLPKPKLHKHRARNNPRPTASDICRYCQTPFASTHECFGGPNRQLSIKHKLQVKLCHTCHQEITDNIRPDRVLEIKQYGQEKFEESHSRAEFMDLFKVRSYL